MAAPPPPFPRPTTMQGIRRIVVALVGGMLLALGLAAAGLLGLAMVLIPGVLGILAMESERARHRLGKAKDFLLRANPLSNKEAA